MTPETTAPAIRARLLPPDEWDKLAGTPLVDAPVQFDPSCTLVIVVEQGDQVIACWAAMNTMHVEGLWIDADHRRNFGVARALMEEMVRRLLAAGVEGVLTQANDPGVEALIKHAGGKLVPGTTWYLKLEG